ncbi:probable chitinase 10 [Wyeomyia smithii]|uniref:probable chitinase 10 n=1 Tax=Wyeomyia smithii TaxID=174621 RepID=UPI002467DCF6|nr:probable chitinase 10 [Wyeomyia smithii]
MEAFFVLTTILLLESTCAKTPHRAQPDARCPRFDDPDEIILLPHSNDCSKFVTCLSGLGYEMNCPEGLEYSVAQTTCDYPEYAQCRMRKETIQTASNGFNILQLPPRPHVEVNQNWEEKFGIEPNPAEKEPELAPEAVPVAENNEPVLENFGISGAFDRRCPDVDHPRKVIHLPVVGSCSKFLKCAGGRAYIMDCPVGLEFSVVTKKCDYPARAKCSILPLGASVPSVVVADSLMAVRIMIQPSRKAAPKASIGALILILAIAVVSVCALPEYYPQYYYQSQQHWEYPQWNQPQVQPKPQPQQQPQLSADGYKIVPGVIDSRCPRTDDPINPIHLPIRGDCRKFMKCYGGRAYEQECPAGLEFGVEVNRCDYPALARCSGW